MREEPELSPEALEVLADLQRDAWRADPQRFSDDFLFQFVLGWLAPADEEALIDALTRSAPLRHRLAAVQDAAERGEAGVPFWKALSQAVGILREVQARGLIAVWSEAKGRFDVTELIGGALLQPGSRGLPSFAIHRSAHEVASNPVPGGEWNVAAVVDADGSLRIRGTAASHAGRSIVLILNSPDAGFVRLGDVSVDDQGHFELAVPSVAPFLEVGQVSPSMFVLGQTGGDEFALPMQAKQEWLWVELAGTPEVREGKLTMSFDLTPYIRSRYPEGTVEVSLRLGKLDFPLGAWAVSDISANTPLSCDLPFVSDGVVPPFALKFELS